MTATPTSLLVVVVANPRLYVHLVPAFVTLLVIGGQVGLPILILTCLRFKRLNRHSTFVNCCLASIIYSLVFSILLSLFSLSLPVHLSDFSGPPFQCCIEYILGNIGLRCLITLSVLHRHLWSWPFSRCAFAHSQFPVACKQTDASVGCPSLFSCLCSRYNSQFLRQITKLICKMS